MLQANRLLPALAAILALLAFSSRTAYADDVCRMNDGYIEKGIGGTGIEQENVAEGGIGGTGIRLAFISGTIYAHGSICVNGLRVAYNDHTPVLMDGVPARVDDLQLGLVVQVLAEPGAQGDTLSARKISIHSLVQGPVEKVDRERHQVRVMGQRIRISGMRDISLLREGMTVQVSGIRNPGGMVVASRVATKPADVPDSVTGRFRKDEAQHAFVDETPVTFGPDMPVPAEGERIHASGTWSGTALQVERMETHSAEEMKDAVFASVEGYVEDKLPDGRAVVDGHIVRPDRTEDIREGMHVIVSGALEDDGEMEAESLHEPSVMSTHVGNDHFGHEPPAPAPAVEPHVVTPQNREAGNGRGPHTEDKHVEFPGEAGHGDYAGEDESGEDEHADSGDGSSDDSSDESS